MHKFDLAFFGAVPYDHLLRGRTGAFVDNLVKQGFFVYYFEIPPASILQIVKEPTFKKRGFIKFFWPPVKVTENLATFAFPPIFPASRFDTGWIKNLNVNRFVRRIRNKYSPLAKKKNRPVVALVVTPYWYEIINRLQFSMLIYDCIDDVKVFCKEKHIAYFTELQRKLVEKSDLTIISAHKLRDDILAVDKNAQIEYIANGVDADFFIRKGHNAPIPEALKNMPKPIIGFIGSLFHWVDIDLIAKTAQTYPNYSFVLVGPVHEITIPKLPNIYHLGAKPYADIPAYVNAFDVCLIPFIQDPLSDKVDPIKVYEYLALGKPVVAINLPELEKMKDLICLAKDDNQFIAMTKQAVFENNPELRDKRIQYAKENSWNARVSDLIKVVSSHLNDKLNKSLKGY
ncbi:MAG: glycosyltransferase [Candidatus Latescibacteria bacterium]|nr:glycosyltransferase [Candidatus Latescibacterota bacterium]